MITHQNILLLSVCVRLKHPTKKRECKTCDLGVWLAGFRVESLSDDAAIADDDTTHHRVGAGVAGGLARQLHAPAHVVSVQVPGLLCLAPHAAPDKATGRDAGLVAGAGKGDHGGGADGPRGEVRARDERGGHGRRAGARQPNPREDARQCRGGRRRQLLGRQRRTAARGGIDGPDRTAAVEQSDFGRHSAGLSLDREGEGQDGDGEKEGGANGRLGMEEGTATRRHGGGGVEAARLALYPGATGGENDERARARER